MYHRDWIGGFYGRLAYIKHISIDEKETLLPNNALVESFRHLSLVFFGQRLIRLQFGRNRGILIQKPSHYVLDVPRHSLRNHIPIRAIGCNVLAITRQEIQAAAVLINLPYMRQLVREQNYTFYANPRLASGSISVPRINIDVAAYSNRLSPQERRQ